MNQSDNPVLFVGAGPGDPELITVKGKNALQAADLIVYAGSLVSEDMLTWAAEGCNCVDSAGLDLDEIIEIMAEAHGKGQKVVRLHTGDPSLYGAVAEQFALLEERGIGFRVIPGITAAFAAAAELALEYTLPEVTQTLILTRAGGRTPVPPAEELASLAEHHTSIAIYLSASLAEKVSQSLCGAFGPQSAVALAYRVSWPDQRLVWTTAGELPQALEGAGLKRQVLILAGPALERLAGQKEAGARSRLYDPTFSHGFRPHKM